VFVMPVSLSIAPGAAYGADEDVPSRPVGMSVDDAIYHTVHGYPGGVAALAARMGVPANTLTHKANPNTTTHSLRPNELVAMQYLSGDASVLHAMAAALGYACVPVGDEQAGGDPVEAFMHMQTSYADLVRAIADPLARMRAEPDRMVTGAEMRRADRCAGDHHSTVDGALAALRGHMRPEPKAAP
jgi:hypothetical protein